MGIRRVELLYSCCVNPNNRMMHTEYKTRCTRAGIWGFAYRYILAPKIVPGTQKEFNKHLFNKGERMNNAGGKVAGT